MRRGFTIIEVMVAILILTVSLVSIFGVQYTSLSFSKYKRRVTQATGLARCKMSEVELDILVENGFEEMDVTESGDCCEILEDDPTAGEYICSWEIKTVEMPDITTLMSAAGGGDTDIGSGDFTEGGGAGMAEDFGMGEMVGAIAPMISSMLKEAMRRVTVKVEWQDGSRTREVIISQYLVHPTQGPLQLLDAAATAQERMDQAEEAGMEMPEMTPKDK